ncbi:uncharacterized protein LOC132545939 [Ylistrum balloti]|uniref:uncharacterized protein LOC132545939 n=1 Tax=Ylistrum balloti TaxID=509963 RepID=UPI0029058984|nr:uncharacterized protein LOC132545939 [Ylistrum balloti]
MTTKSSHSEKNRNIPLTLTAKYASTWGSWEGVRELVQNWHDGIYDTVNQRGVSLISKNEIIFCEEGNNHNFKACLVNSDTREETILGRLIYNQFENKLTLINSCTELHKKILLLGYSGKSSSKEIIGQFGEGLKVGALALVRNGHLVTMETCNDRWRFDLIHNEEFGEKVLTVVVTERLTSDRSDCIEEQKNGYVLPTDTCTTITGIEDWKKFLPRFLFLKPPVDSVKTQLGSLLLDESLSGQLYVKGLWVSDLSDEDLAAGVNFTFLQLDRDRNAVPKPSEIDHMMSGIWIRAIERRPELTTKYFHLLKSERYRDVRHAAEYITDDLSKNIASEFLNEFSVLAFPMLNSSTADQMAAVNEELNLTAILCNQTLYEILMKSGSYRSLENALEEKRAKQRKPVALFSLTPMEVSVLMAAIDLAKLVNSSMDISMFDVMETSLTETCSGDGTRFCVPRWYLDPHHVHKRGSLCGKSTVTEEMADCKCCEVILCAAVLELEKKPEMYKPSTYLVQKLITKSSSQDMLSNQHGFKDGHSCTNSLNNEVFIAREMKLQEKIQQLEESITREREEAMNKILVVKKKLKEAEHHLTQREISVIDVETHLRESYKTEIEQYQKKSQAKVEELMHLLAKKEDVICNLEATVNFKQEELSQVKKQLEVTDAAAERKMGCLLDELAHSISQNRNRTKSLSKLCAEQCQSIEKGNKSREKWELLQKLCDTILQELQEEKILCSACKRKRKDCIIQPCGHYCLCNQCADLLLSEKAPCPVCRSTMSTCLKVYDT